MRFNIRKKNNTIFGSIKTYYDLPSGDLILGLMSNEKIIKQNINFNNNPYSFIISENLNLDTNITCVLLKNDNNNFTSISYGNDKSDNFKNKIINNIKNSISKINAISNTQTNNINNNEEKKETLLHKNSHNVNNVELIQTNFTPDIKQNIDEDILDYTSEVAVATSELFESTDEEIENILDKELHSDNTIFDKTTDQNKNFSMNQNNKFYNMISDQIDELFNKYPREYNLEKLIDNSQWVKINFDNDDRFYVVGLIYENENIQYVCYGVPGNFDQAPPRELQGYSQWLPTDATNPYTNGYWVMYQDADTGENILIE